MSAVLAPQPPSEVSPEAMAAAGLRAFARIAEAWGLSVDEQLALLGQPPRSTFFAWRKHPEKASLPRDTLERTFKAMLARDDCGLLLINQPIADAIRPVVNAHRAIIPMVLEIPSKDVAYDAKKDPLMKRVLQMLGEDV